MADTEDANLNLRPNPKHHLSEHSAWGVRKLKGEAETATDSRQQTAHGKVDKRELGK